MKPCAVLLLAVAFTCGAWIIDDLDLLGVPVISAEIGDSMLVVTMAGSLAEGDSLLKHYGGVFFTLVDSIAGGWDVYGLEVRLEEANLVFRRCDMMQMLIELSDSTDDEIIADWVLSNTRVFRYDP